MSSRRFYSSIFFLHRRTERARRGAEDEARTQPGMRVAYGGNMGGVDTADQQNGSHTHDHKSYNNHWRRVFEQKIEQSLTNAYLLFKKHLARLKFEAGNRLDDSDESTKCKLDRAIRELDRLAKLERADWDELLCTALMAMCNAGSERTGGKQVRPHLGGAVWGSVGLKQCTSLHEPCMQS